MFKLYSKKKSHFIVDKVVLKMKKRDEEKVKSCYWIVMVTKRRATDTNWRLINVLLACNSKLIEVFLS